METRTTRREPRSEHEESPGAFQFALHGARSFGELRRRGAVESWVELLEHRHPFHTLDVRGGVLADDAAAMMREFFAARR